MQGLVILGAALAFAGVAFLSDWPRGQSSCATTVEVIKYFPAPEPTPIYPAPKLLPVNEIGPPAIETKPQPEVKEPETEEAPRHLRRERVHHYRRHWRRH